MARVSLPNAWQPREYQKASWDYLESGGRNAIIFAHRRWGKDDVALHRAACAAFERVGNYWHMLPEASQARKAIWHAVDPHVGKRRIDIAFPPAIRSKTLENEMLIQFRNGSTWQVVGSDNYNSLVGAPPVGVVSSEHALANPAAFAYLQPIFLENNGWFLAITTARGKNHAYAMLQTARADPSWYSEVTSAAQTGVFTAEQLEKTRTTYHGLYGFDQGDALFAQEYLCSFEAAVLGAYYTRELADMRATNRIGEFPWVEGLPVYVGGDLGRTDSLALWFWQMVNGAPRFIDYFQASGQDVESTVAMLKGDHGDESREANARRSHYRYGDPALWLPHDAKPETYAAPRSVQRQFKDAGYRSRIVPGRDVQEGIQAARSTLKVARINERACKLGLEALSEYRREWDQEKRMFSDKPLHNWASHGADGMRYCAIGWRQDWEPPKPEPVRFPLAADVQPTFQQALNMVRERRERLDG